MECILEELPISAFALARLFHLDENEGLVPMMAERIVDPPPFECKFRRDDQRVENRPAELIEQR